MNLLGNIPAHVEVQKGEIEPCLVVAIDGELLLLAMKDGSLERVQMSWVKLDYRYVDGEWWALENLEKGPDGQWMAPEVGDTGEEAPEEP